MSIIKYGPNSILVASQSGNVTTYFNHQPERLVQIWKLYPDCGRLYSAEGLIGIRHNELIAGKNRSAEYIFSVATSGFRTCQTIAAELARFRPASQSSES